MALARAEAMANRGMTEDKSEALLSSLREAHGRLLAAMDVLDHITRQPLADRARFPNARWRLSAASLARRALWKTCFQYLLPIVDRQAARALEAYNREDFELLAHSTAHIARWSADAVEREWPAYCNDSRTIRRLMSAAIEAEQRLLYPILRLQTLSGSRRLAQPGPLARMAREPEDRPGQRGDDDRHQ